MDEKKPSSVMRLMRLANPVAVQRYLLSALVLALVLLAGAGGFSWLRTRVAADIYQDRLAALSDEYEGLRARYNQAVRRTAVTELLVDGSRLVVCVRTVDGVIKTIETPFNPANELYIDFIVKDGRLWIRRLFDSATPPNSGLLIDPALGDIDWTSATVQHGKAVYRQLTDGRWVVTVSGDGSLGLARRDAGRDMPLAAAPPIRDYPLIEEEMAQTLREIRTVDILRQLLRRP